ncbi:hypothetical protein ABIE13_005226 [Ottowia thiooxydans]|uniref:Uncharacterized protein n=1 Tax=Ottowia thiooxydans TaxID=219182 RepID=A0ABV2QGP8_9BURK
MSLSDQDFLISAKSLHNREATRIFFSRTDGKFQSTTRTFISNPGAGLVPCHKTKFSRPLGETNFWQTAINSGQAKRRWIRLFPLGAPSSSLAILRLQAPRTAKLELGAPRNKSAAPTPGGSQYTGNSGVTLPCTTSLHSKATSAKA